MSVVCDNNGEYKISQDGGNTFNTFYNDLNPHKFIDGLTGFETMIVPIPVLTENTVLRFACTDNDNVGGFIATIRTHSDKKEYSTQQPITDSKFSIISDSSSGLVYRERTDTQWFKQEVGPYYLGTDAKFIWNEQNKNTMIFEFKLFGVEPTDPSTPITTTTSTTITPTTATNTKSDGMCCQCTKNGCSADTDCEQTICKEDNYCC